MELITTAEALHVLGVTRAQFRGQLSRGEIAPVERAARNGKMKFSRDDVERLKKMMRTVFAHSNSRQPAGK